MYTLTCHFPYFLCFTTYLAPLLGLNKNATMPQRHHSNIWFSKSNFDIGPPVSTTNEGRWSQFSIVLIFLISGSHKAKKFLLETMVVLKDADPIISPMGVIFRLSELLGKNAYIARNCQVAYDIWYW